MRRLLLLMGIIAVASMPLAARLWALTSTSSEHLADARTRMERRQWLPAVRGSIRDRKGRVLAEDRPTYDLAVDYRVISGSWAADQARSTARRLAGRRWLDLAPEQRDALTAELRPTFDAHVERGWNTLASIAGLPREQIEQSRANVIAQVEARQNEVTTRRMDRELAEWSERGKTPNDAERRKLERRASEDIAEKRQAHVIIPRVGDSAGFTAQSLATEVVEVAVATRGAADALGLPSDRREVLPAIPGLSVIDSTDRIYPLERQSVLVDRSHFPHAVSGGVMTVEVDGVAIHLLGKLRDQSHGSTRDDKGVVTPGDADRRSAYLTERPDRDRAVRLPDGTDRGAYWSKDRVGDTGVEGRQEQSLRGLRGLALTHLDTGGRDWLAPEPGDDVTLTIDAVLQARVQAVMEPRAGLAVVQPWHGATSEFPLPLGTPLFGAAVVLDVETGEVLAAVSTPTFSRAQAIADPMSIYRDELARPAINRAIAAAYPPGSIVKPLILCGAARAGVMTLDEHITCNGYLYDNNPNQLQCMIWKKYKSSHNERLGHDPGPVEAIGVSCNIYFYTMGRRLGPSGITTVYQSFGVGSRFGLGAGYEAPGQVGAAGRDITAFDATLMGIGQGPVTWSPLHAANAYATLARSGDWIPPRIVLEGGVQPVPAGRSLDLDQRAVSAALAGLDYAVNNPGGSGNHMTSDDASGAEAIFNVEGVKVWGKTGTAEAPNLTVDEDADGPGRPRIVRQGDHSWFVVLAGADKPKYAVSVVIEYGGSGAKVSGPIVNQILHALRAEGYF